MMLQRIDISTPITKPDNLNYVNTFASTGEEKKSVVLR